MKMYHASKHKFDIIERNQVEVPDDIVVPKSELQNKIYLTPSFGFALAMAAGPDGITFVENGRISFEHANEFDPEKVVYVYEVDSDLIPPELIEEIDDEQVAVDINELLPTVTHRCSAKQVFEHYKFIDWDNVNK